jgi:hypothetical protein
MYTAKAVVAGLALAGFIYAQQAPPAGHYEGVLKTPKQDLNIALDLEKHATKGWVGSVDLNMPNAPKGLLVESISVEGDAVSWVLPAFAGSKFSGKHDVEQKTLNGTVATPGGALPFELKRTGDSKVSLPAPSTAIDTDLQGKWEGTLTAGDNALRLSITFASGPDGKGTGDILSIDQQGSPKVALTTVTQDGKNVKFEARSIAGSYIGTLNDAKTELSGEWTQGGLKAPLVLKKQPK